MKKILIAIFILCSVQSFGQATFRIKDSTLRFMTGTLTSKLPQVVRPITVESLSRIDSSGKLKMLVVDTTRAALGLKSVYWMNIPSGGSGGGGGGTPGGSNKQFQYNNSSSFGGSGNLTQETNQVLLTGSSTSVVPFRITPASGATVSAFRVDNYLGDSVFTIDPTGNIYAGKQTTVNYTRTFQFAYGLNAYSTAGFRIKDIASGNGVVLNAATGGYLDVRDISGSGGGIVLSNIKNPNDGEFITAGSGYWRTSGAEAFGVATAPDASAILHAQSTTKGFLPPRMTATQAEAISSPAEGLMIYSTNGAGATITSKGWWGYDGSAWVKLN